MDNTFLPESYEVPGASDKYMKFIKGENRFRILCSPILGYEYWVEEGDKRIPKRTPMDKPFSIEVAENPEDIKHFWAMVGYNYQSKEIQILEVTQSSILSSLKDVA